MRTALPILLLGLLRVISILSLAVKPPPHFRWASWLLITGICYYLVFYTSTGGPANYPIACLAAMDVFTATDYILLTDAQRHLFLVGQQTPICDSPFLSRLRWAFKLSFSPRGVGWIHEPTSVLRPHPPPTMSRTAFVTSQLCSMLLYILVLDITTIYTENDPSFVAGGQSFAAGGWIWRFVNVTVSGTQAICHLCKQYYLFSAILVTLGLSTPQEWPPILGSWRDAYTLRKFYGRSWHQLMRRFVSSHGKFLAHKVLHLERGTIASSYVQLYTAFLISGIIHSMGDYMLLSHFGGHGFRFFVLQALAVTCEDGVIAFSSKVVGVKGGRAWRLLGYIWVLGWFAYSVPALMDPLIDAGYSEIGQQHSLVLKAWQMLRKRNMVSSTPT